MTRTHLKLFRPVIVFFACLTALFVVGKTMFDNWGVDRYVLIVGNLILFVITFISFYLGIKGLNHPNPHAFVRSLYTSIMIKLFLCIIAALIYIASYREALNKPALFACMALYLVYTFLEVTLLMKMLRQKEQ